MSRSVRRCPPHVSRSMGPTRTMQIIAGTRRGWPPMSHRRRGLRYHFAHTLLLLILPTSIAADTRAGASQDGFSMGSASTKRCRLVQNLAPAFVPGGCFSAYSAGGSLVQKTIPNVSGVRHIGGGLSFEYVALRLLFRARIQCCHPYGQRRRARASKPALRCRA